MFVWTPENVLIAIDAGIPEVIRIHNRAYTNATTHGVGLRGPRYDLVPIFHPGTAFAVAMDTTVAVLNLVEPVEEIPSTLGEIALIEALGL